MHAFICPGACDDFVSWYPIIIVDRCPTI